MTVSELMKFYKVKNQSQLAKKIGRGRTTITDWKNHGIPPRTQALFEIKTAGKLKADLEVAV